MTLIKRSGFLPVYSNNFMDQFFNSGLFDTNDFNFSGKNMTLPAVNIREDEDQIVIEMAAPGLKKEDFKINLNNNQLTISADKKEEESVKDQRFSRKEFRYSKFQRLFTVPVELIDGDKVAANYEDGILRVSLPRREELKPKPAREISIL